MLLLVLTVLCRTAASDSLLSVPLLHVLASKLCRCGALHGAHQVTPCHQRFRESHEGSLRHHVTDGPVPLRSLHI